jgi:hypothetical protein
MNPSSLTSASAAEHVCDLRTAATRARLAAAATACRRTAIDRALRLLHTGRSGPDVCPGT